MRAVVDGVPAGDVHAVGAEDARDVQAIAGEEAVVTGSPVGDTHTVGAGKTVDVEVVAV